MDKNTKKPESTPIGSSVVVSATLNFRRSHRRLATTIIGVCLLVCLSISTSLYYLHVRNNREKINLIKLAALFKSNDCSDKALQSVSSEKPNPKQVDASIWLLGYQASCFNQKGKYQNAVDVLTQLESYYQMKNDIGMVKEIAREIAADTYNLSHPIIVDHNSKPDANPATLKSIQQIQESK